MSQHKLTLNLADLKTVDSLVQEIKSKIGNPTEENVLSRAPVYAHELPRNVRDYFYDFTANETADAILVSTGDFFADSTADTPSDYVELDSSYTYNDSQIAHALMSTLVGTPVGYSSQRSGRRLNNIIPIQDFETVPNSSSGSKFNFGFHTEDAFHEFKGDYLGLVCMRNDEKAVTSFVSINEMKITPLLKAALFKPDYVIGHNPIHSLPENHKLPRMSVLYGSWSRPYMRINVNNTSGVNRSAQYALEELIGSMNAATERATLNCGDFFYLDNLYAAHARDAYIPNWGNKARWLSRFILSKDIRKSSIARKNQLSFVIENDYESSAAFVG